MTLVEFLRARLAEDEQAARDAAAANPGSPATHWSAEQVDYPSGTGLRGQAWAVVPERVRGATVAVSPADILPRRATHIARHDPARVLADVEAKRRIVDDFTYWQPHDPGFDALELAVQLLALPYADHPDYDEAWRP